MLRAITLTVLFAQMLVLVVGCGETVKFQNEFRGKWVLESRKLPDGQELKPPAFSGFLEWFPISEKQSHVTTAVSSGEENLQLADNIYILKDQTFALTEYTRIGGGYSSPPQPGSGTPGVAAQGRIAIEDSTITLAHPDGKVCAYEGATLTVTHRDGTVDIWKRSEDQKGLLTE